MGEEHKQEQLGIIRKLGGRTTIIGVFILLYGLVITFLSPRLFPESLTVEKIELFLKWGTYTVVTGGLVIAGLIKLEDVVRIIKAKVGLESPKEE